MATDAIDISLVSVGDLSSKQYYFVKLDTAGKVAVCSATTDRPLGVVQNDPTAGQAAIVRLFGHTKVNADAALALGDVLGTSADGQAAVYVAGTDTTKYLMGFCTKAAGAAGDEAEMILTPVARGA